MFELNTCFSMISFFGTPPLSNYVTPEDQRKQLFTKAVRQPPSTEPETIEGSFLGQPREIIPLRNILEHILVRVWQLRTQVIQPAVIRTVGVVRPHTIAQLHEHTLAELVPSTTLRVNSLQLCKVQVVLVALTTSLRFHQSARVVAIISFQKFLQIRALRRCASPGHFALG